MSRCRRVAVALGAGLVAGLLLVAPAWGVSTDCAGLPTALANAQPGDTIDLTELCRGGSFQFPAASDVTLDGAAAGDGFDGTGAIGPALHGIAPAGLTLRNLTFENYNLTNASAVNLQVSSGVLPVIDQDSFVNNTNTSTGEPAGGGLDIFGNSTACQYTGSLTISHSLFSGNGLVSTFTSNPAGGAVTGGGASVSFECTSPGTASLRITGNTFEQNSIRTAGPTALGGGLYAANGGNGQLTATQSANLFESNSIVNTGSTAATFDGGGEWLASVNLVSTSDGYIGNSLPGPAVGSASEGAGLGAVRGSCGTPASTVTTSAVATNLVAAGNSIGAPSGGDVEGAGVYAGCEATTGSQGFALTLYDSTVSGNAGPGGAAGVDGESGDSLTLQNSIVAGNTGAGASDIGGFGATPGENVTAIYSDVCAIGSAVPFAGTGNICANPLLAGATTGDVHETAASPTIDAGSNVIVPVSPSADYYGQPRIVATKQARPIIDIGAAEWQTAFAAPPLPLVTPITPPLSARVQVVKVKATSHGVNVMIRCVGTPA
jgi:hypothetical protein